MWFGRQAQEALILSYIFFLLRLLVVPPVAVPKPAGCGQIPYTKSMSVRVITQIAIAAPRPVVFEYLTDLKYHHLWNPQVQSLAGSGVLEKGSTYQTTSLLLGIKVHSHNKVTLVQSPRRLVIENDAGLVHYKAEFQLEADGDKTVVVCSTNASADSVAFAFTKPVMKLLARRELQTDLQALKIAVEQKLS
jgi:hypothetical protein